MQHRFVEDGSSYRVVISGALHFNDHQEWRHMVHAALDHACSRIVVDLTTLETVDSAGLGLIMMFRTKVLEADRQFALIPPADGPAAHAVKLMRLDSDLCSA